MRKLSYNAGKFVLSGTDLDAAVGLDDWNAENGKYVTTDLKAAARLAKYADERTQKIFDRVFVKKYPRPPVQLPEFLDPHQREGVLWVLTRGRSYLAHAPGAGKTCEAIIASLLTGCRGQVLFVVPPSLTVNWARETMKFYDLAQPDPTYWPGVAVIPESANREFTGWRAQFLIVPDSMLTRPWVLDRLIKLPKRFVAVDEASRFKDPTAQRTLALFGGRLQDGRVSTGIVRNARHVVLLDGSPMPNNPMELWAPTYALYPEAIDFMSRENFGFRYCGAAMNKFGQWEFKRSAREQELREKLQKDFMHVVPESALSHPERKRSLLFMSSDPRTPEMKSWERKHLKGLDLDAIDEETSQGELARYRAELGLTKVNWIAQYISERLGKDESILLFAWHREVCFALEKKLLKFKPGLVIGGTDADRRERAFAAFQSGSLKLIIGNIAAMGRGHNLQRADRVVFGEYSWTDELNKQCEKRASRKGSEKDFVRCDYIVVPNSFDEMVLSSVFTKAKRVKRIIGE